LSISVSIPSKIVSISHSSLVTDIPTGTLLTNGSLLLLGIYNTAAEASYPTGPFETDPSVKITTELAITVLMKPSISVVLCVLIELIGLFMI